MFYLNNDKFVLGRDRSRMISDVSLNELYPDSSL